MIPHPRPPFWTPAVRRATAMVVIAAAISILNARWGEVTLAGGGVGWDGRLYAKIAEAWPKGVLNGEIEGYHLQRIVPSAIVATALHAMTLPLTTENIIVGFQWLNSFLLLLAVLFWALTARQLKLSAQASWLGFAFLFLNYPVLKQFTFLPLNTDQSALTISIALLYLFLARRQIALLTVSFIAAFCWPTAFHAGLLLFACPRSPIGRPARPARFAILAAVLAAMASTWLELDSYYARQYRPTSGALLAALPLSFAIPPILVAVALFVLIQPLTLKECAAQFLERLKGWPIYAAIAVVTVVTGIVKTFGGPGGVSPEPVIRSMAVQGLAAPGIGLVAHSVYYGPLIPLAILHWKRIVGAMRTFGLGLTLAVGVNVVQAAFDTESRREIVLVPLLAVFLSQVSDRQRWPATYAWTIGALCLFYSKIWMLFNAYGMPSAEPGKWPMQMLFMNIGPWMTVETYAIQGAIVAVTFLVLAYLFDRLRLASASHYAPGSSSPVPSFAEATDVRTPQQGKRRRP